MDSDTTRSDYPQQHAGRDGVPAWEDTTWLVAD